MRKKRYEEIPLEELVDDTPRSVAVKDGYVATDGFFFVGIDGYWTREARHATPGDKDWSIWVADQLRKERANPEF